MKDESQICYFNWPKEKENIDFHWFMEKATEKVHDVNVSLTKSRSKSSLENKHESLVGTFMSTCEMEFRLFPLHLEVLYHQANLPKLHCSYLISPNNLLIKIADRSCRFSNRGENTMASWFDILASLGLLLTCLCLSFHIYKVELIAVSV